MTEPVTIYDNRFEVYAKLKSIICDGDVLYRGSDARGAFGFPFMRFVSKLTQSEYTHAAIARVKNGEVFVAEATDTGTMLYRFIDWYQFTLGGKFCIASLDFRQVGLRAQSDVDLFQARLAAVIDWYLEQDRNYNFRFQLKTNEVYCTQMICEIYEALDFKICEPQVIKEIVGWHKYILIKAGNALFTTATHGAQSLPMKTPMYYVGNKTNGGMLSSPIMRLKYES